MDPWAAFVVICGVVGGRYYGGKVYCHMMNMQSLFDYGVRVNSVLVPWLVQQRLVRECKNLAKTGFRFRDNQDSRTAGTYFFSWDSHRHQAIATHGWYVIETMAGRSPLLMMNDSWTHDGTIHLFVVSISSCGVVGGRYYG